MIIFEQLGGMMIIQITNPNGAPAATITALHSGPKRIHLIAAGPDRRIYSNQCDNVTGWSG